MSPSIPIFTASTPMSCATARTCARIISAGTGETAVTADGVLGGDRRDRGHAVHAAGGERLQVGLDPGAAAGVRAGDREHPRYSVVRGRAPAPVTSMRTERRHDGPPATSALTDSRRTSLPAPAGCSPRARARPARPGPARASPRPPPAHRRCRGRRRSRPGARESSGERGPPLDRIAAERAPRDRTPARARPARRSISARHRRSGGAGPADPGAVTRPGTAPTGRPSSRARRAVTSAPERAPASTTTVARASAGDQPVAGQEPPPPRRRLPGGSSEIASPRSTIRRCSARCDAGYGRSGPRREHRDRRAPTPPARPREPRLSMPSAIPLRTGTPRRGQAARQRASELAAVRAGAARPDERDADRIGGGQRGSVSPRRKSAAGGAGRSCERAWIAAGRGGRRRARRRRRAVPIAPGRRRRSAHSASELPARDVPPTAAISVGVAELEQRRAPGGEPGRGGRRAGRSSHGAGQARHSQARRRSLTPPAPPRARTARWRRPSAISRSSSLTRS